jgi:molybdopterin synthase catalytic subunit
MSKQDNYIFFHGAIPNSMVSEIISASVNYDIGAHSIFLGEVRSDLVGNKIVKEIEYSAYAPMATEVMKNIVDSINQKYDDLKLINIIHSIGIVKVGEISLLVYIGCGHRLQAFKANQEIVELIKEKLPVWKKEIFEDGSHTWPQNYI